MWGEAQATELKHIPTNKEIEHSSYIANLRLAAKSSIKLKVENAYIFNHGDKITFKFPLQNNTQFLYEFHGIIKKRNLKENTIEAYDYATILEQKISFSRNKYIGEDFIMAIKDIIEIVDKNNMIDTSYLHGTAPQKFINYEDNISANNESAWKIIKNILSKVYDDTKDYYLLPYFIYFEEKGQIFIEKQQDIEDESNYPAVMDFTHADNIIDIQVKERDDNICNICTGIGDGIEITVQDENSIAQYTDNNADYRKYHKVIKYDTKNKDELQQKCIDYIRLNRELKSDYELEAIDAHSLKRNTIVNLKLDEFGIDGRFLITNIKIDSKMRTVITVSGSKLPYL